jgi:hypothetical protein
MMLKEWLLIATVGTSSNFVVLSTHPTVSSCDLARTEMIEQGVTKNKDVKWICTQNLSEGRSQYSRRPGSGGIAGKTQ